jgi:hypothetical protein
MPTRFLYPRPEYPRPDFQRGALDGYDWLNLNGPWRFRFDPARRGVPERWFEPDERQWREQIIVPFCWESLAAWGEGDTAGNDHYYSTRVFLHPLEVTRANHRSAPRYEVGWYRRSVVVPTNDAWQGKRVILHIGAADFFTDCWCNGKHLGSHEGGYTPFEFDLTDTLDPSGKPTLIVLRVEDPMDNSEQPVGKQWRWYTTTSGIWQTVYLEPRNSIHIAGFRIVTDIDAGMASFSVRCANPPPNSEIELEIVTPSSKVQTSRLPLRDGTASGNIKPTQVALWDPNSPNLYTATLRLLLQGKTADTVRTFFGMRKIDFEIARESGVPTALRVNGMTRYLRGALYQSYYPEGVYTAASVETLKDDIAYAKKFGFNFLRIHIKVDDPLVLYWADKLGILLMADFPNFGEGGDTPLGRKRFETMMRETVDRDFNHPSIFAWCLFNETWGFGGQAEFMDTLTIAGTAAAASAAAAANATRAPAVKKPAAGARPGMTPPQVWVQQMWELAKKLDPTRLVEDMSVCHWEHLEYYLHCDTDINSWHFYISDYQKAKAHIDKVVASTFVGSSFNYVPGFLHKGQPLINSEYGGIGALDGDRDVSWSFKFLTNELRLHQQVAAYIYTELHDVEWEYNGFLNYDRTPKEFGYDPRIINESNTLPIDGPPAQRVAPGQVIKVKVASSHFSTRPYRDVSLIWRLGGIDVYGRLHQDLVCGRVAVPFPHHRVAPAHPLELQMPKETMLCHLLLTAVTSEGLTVAENFAHFFVTPGYPADREEIARALVLRGAPANWAQAEWSGGSAEREKERAEDCCYGFGDGFFEWVLPLAGADLSKAHRLRILCEASSHRVDAPQTDCDTFPTTLRMLLNGIRVYEAPLRNHPHDSRGVLSYLRGGVGAYGYPAYAIAEGPLLREIVQSTQDDSLRLRCCVPSEALARGGLTIYGAECGRFPVCPTVVIEW